MIGGTILKIAVVKDNNQKTSSIFELGFYYNICRNMKLWINCRTKRLSE